jgi:hypothetical protein
LIRFIYAETEPCRRHRAYALRTLNFHFGDFVDMLDADATAGLLACEKARTSVESM